VIHVMNLSTRGVDERVDTIKSGVVAKKKVVMRWTR
jgi:hypothetical protein